MARLHPVIVPEEYWRLVRRGRLRITGPIYLEAKLDGYLAVAVDGKLYTGNGRRAPGWMHRALEEAGADPFEAGRGRLLFIEVYGACASPLGFHRRDPRCYRAALVDAGRPPAYAGSVEEAALLARTLEHCERIGLAERGGFETPAYRVVHATAAPEPWELTAMLDMFRGYEGYVLKLYSSQGHRLPPDHAAKLRGLLEVKVRHAQA